MIPLDMESKLFMKNGTHQQRFLAGDGIYTIAQIILNEISSNSVLLSKYFNKTTLEICEGQALTKNLRMIMI